jgi:hypothetical protein
MRDMLNPMGEVTALLRRWSSGDKSPLEKPTPLVYDEIKRLASYYLRMEPGQPSLPSTAIVHEAYLRLLGSAEVDRQDRHHFLLWHRR